uniref:DEK_C domain-containing protein n=1 Tax=Rhabditophanes sp. KR3021 TaxID=114890 RepID=A0AC35TGU8_9BILA
MAESISETNIGDVRSKLRLLADKCKGKGMNVKEALCRDADKILKRAEERLDTLKNEKKNAIENKDTKKVETISKEIMLLKESSLMGCYLDLLFQERYTDEVVEEYIQDKVDEEKVKIIEEEIKSKNANDELEKEQKLKLEKKVKEQKEKELKKIREKDEYIKAMNLGLITKNEHLTRNRNNDNKKDISDEERKTKKEVSFSDDEDEEEPKKKPSNKKAASIQKNKSSFRKQQSSEDESDKFMENVDSHINEIVQPFKIDNEEDPKSKDPSSTNSGNKVGQSRSTNVCRRGPTEEEVKVAMSKVRDEKDEEMEKQMDRYFKGIEEILEGKNK